MRRPVLPALLAAVVGATLTVAVTPSVAATPIATTAPAASADRDRPATTSWTAERTPISVTRHRPSAVTTAGGVKAYPVPASAAALRRITTAPDGNLWFVEQATNKIGRITPAGAITEFQLPAQTSEGSLVKDLDIASDGTVWVAWDSGWHVTRFHPSAPGEAYSWSFEYPYAEEIRVGPGNVAWATVSFDVDGIVRFSGTQATWDANAPGCDGALGRGRDGLMWCQAFDRLIRVNSVGTGGTFVPLPSDATYPYSIAPGPTGSIWFGRDDGGSMFTSPSDGNIGWVTTGGSVRTIRLGSYTAPRSLVQGPGEDMWFTSVGRVPAVGHLSQRGVGAITKVGNYKPTSLTIAKDGAVWFTDSEHNVIVRVPRSSLQRTNIDVGSRSQLARAAVKVAARRLDSDRRRATTTVGLTCSKGIGRCAGKIVIRKGRSTLGAGSYALLSVSKGKGVVKLTAAARRILEKQAKVKVQLVLRPQGGRDVTRTVVLTR